MGKILHASGSGYFVECVSVGASGFGVGVFSLDHFMKMYWRAKEIRFVLQATLTIIDPDGGGGTYFCSTPTDPPVIFQKISNEYGGPSIVNEEEMVCGFYYEANFLENGLLEGVIATSQDVNNPATLYNFGGGLGTIDLGDLNPDLGNTGLIRITLGQPTSFPYNIQGPINFGGVTVQGYLGFTPDEFPFILDTSASSFTASFEVDEYFSFGGTINTSTGEPL
jgi:hypothetical protein